MFYLTIMYYKQVLDYSVGMYFTIQEQGQVFTWLDYISETNTPICTKEEIKRRLLEMMLHACATENRDSGRPVVFVLKAPVKTDCTFILVSLSQLNCMQLAISCQGKSETKNT